MTQLSNEFREIDTSALNENFFTNISKEWMLITAEKTDGTVNTMTASWGGIGFIWRRPVFTCVIRPQRYTFAFAEEAERISLSFMGEGYREQLQLCGSKSGRDMDKISACGFTVIHENGAAYFEQARLVLIGRKLYADMLRDDAFLDRSIIPANYPAKDFHKFYVCEIERVLVRSTEQAL